jgi:hypothetical protein
LRTTSKEQAQYKKEMVLRNSDSPLPGSSRFKPLSPGAALLILLTGFAAILPGRALATAQLIVTPTRVVLAGRTRTASVTLINRGDQVGTFRIKFERMRMTDTGQVVPLKTVKPGELFADQMVRYAPRQVTLQPGQLQVVRLMLRKPPNLPTGEYRSHMLIQTLPSESPSDISQQAGNAHGLSIRLIPIIGVAIPVIVRQGKTSASVTLTKLHLEKRSADGARAMLVLTARRSGNQSVYGDLTVRFTPAKSGSPLVVGRVGGIAVYTPNDHRSVTIALQAPHGVRLQDGTLSAEYRTPANAGNKVLAKASVAIAASGK